MQGRVLSERLYAVASLVTKGNVVADIGCDHGFVPIYLVQEGISPKVIAMDVKEGPLERAREHILEAGLEHKIETRLSNGLHCLNAGEAKSILIAGMGGRLMRRILEQDFEKLHDAQELILQPQSQLEEFRAYLREAGFLTAEEKIIREDGKYYFPMRIVWGKGEPKTEEETRLEDAFGPVLLREKPPLFMEYLESRLHTYEEVRVCLAGTSGDRNRQRLSEIEAKMRQIREAMK